MRDIAGTRVPADFAIEPYTDNCRAVCAQGEHVLIGVSPGNSYFSEERLAALLRWSTALFRTVDVIVPDVSVMHTYRALGDDSERAWSRARSQTRRISRRVARAWETLGVPGDDRPVLTVSQFADHPRYRVLRERFERAVERDPEVRTVFLAASRRALAPRLKGGAPTLAQQEENMRYLLAELPLCTDAPGILGVPSSVNIYHQVIPFIPLVFSSPALRASARQAFAVVRPAQAEGRPAERDGRPVGSAAGGGETGA
ncbi:MULTISPECIES: tRNA-dependent cyclodipeptide synthase [Streptomyces]|uniref:tRNA-dependent cyclodipeptide synthase n=1 Tax=Streptomyces TaxID=1883 RepID=UPI0022495FAF|nr:tRNA-dependent cyclodipeptide synthase [Streptomyces sp. JHD 1]MCX2969579.1 tRNA-dependent cyclodipeptide synthase [Streptomyces sp. JHD 1]